MSYDLKSHVRGDTFEGVTFTINVNSLPRDLTGCRLDMWIREKSATGTIVKKLSSDSNGLTIVDDTNGVFKIDKFLVTFDPGIYYYDIQMTFPDESVKTYIGGTWTILQDVTL